MNLKYQTLVKTLDKICASAPDEYRIFKPARRNINAISAARARAYIHLYLHAIFGVSDFKEAERYITDGGQDGGIDAFVFDTERKKLYLIQSKFKTVEDKFEVTEIDANDLSKMEVTRIIRGEKYDEQGVPYNGKIARLQKLIDKTPDFHRYKIEVVILANLKRLSSTSIRRLIEVPDYEIFDFRKTYDKLILSVCSGTYFNPEEIYVSINLKNKKDPNVEQIVNTSIGSCRVLILFVPTIEIAHILGTYKNSILSFNPRNYLSLNKNEINKKIADSINKNQTNDFAVLNNGITILAEAAVFAGPFGDPEKGRLILTNPQIVNGAQTAYTLSRILEKDSASATKFSNKEVMLRIVEIKQPKEKVATFIEALSDATNQQNRINEADRRSNDPIQISIQKEIFNEFGYFYARKRGEFENGIQDGFLDKSLVIDRDHLVKAYIAYRGLASEARRTSETLFKEKFFRNFFRGSLNYREIFFAYRCFVAVSRTARDRKTSKRTKESLRYSRMAVMAAIGARQRILDGDLDEIAESQLKRVLGRWNKFESHVRTKKANSVYRKRGGMDWDNYYKGGTLNSDIKSFFR